MEFPRTRKAGSIAYKASDSESLRIPRGTVIHYMTARLTGQLTVAGANNTSAKTLPGDGWAAVRNFKIKLDHQDDIMQLSGTELLHLMYVLGQQPPRDRRLLLGDGSTANPNIDHTVLIPFLLPGSRVPRMTALDLRGRRHSDAKVEIDWGSHLSVNADATGWTVAPSIALGLHEITNVKPGRKYGLLDVARRIKVAVSATNSSLQVDMPTSDWCLGWMVRATDAAVDSGSIINNFKWKTGGVDQLDIAAPVLQELMLQKLGLNRSFSGTAYDDEFISDNTNFAGWYVYRRDWDGDPSHALPAGAITENKLELDVTVGGGATEITIVPIIVRPSSRVAPAA